MLFNSLQFLLFFPSVVFLYWILPATGRWRNIMLLIASYYFYMNWEPVYGLLILFSTVSTWAGAKFMDGKSPRVSKSIFTLTILVNVCILLVFKYLNFLGDAIRNLLDMAGLEISIPEFDILLPVGISFYTFQAIGYLVDVRIGRVKAEKDLFTYALFVSFFPQLVAGPIERAKNLLSQFAEKHEFSGARLISGMELMVFGYFMKLCIAENVAPYVDAVFNSLPQHNGTSILLASFFFTFQIFCDFGGYSLIAIGAARCMGFSLMQNFRQPYLAMSVKDFWRRWHISLSSWFSDYVYIPLGGNRVSTGRHFGNLMTTFLLSGVWHGANYTFIAWGAFHGALQCANTSWRKVRPAWWKSNTFTRLVGIVTTFLLVALGFVFFRANNISDAFLAIQKMATERGMLYNGEGKPSIILPIILIGLLMIFEIIHEWRDRKAEKQGNCQSFNHGTKTSIAVSSFLIVVILLTAQFDGGQFIYFQF